MNDPTTTSGGKKRIKELVEDKDMGVGDAARQMINHEGYESHYVWMNVVDDVYPAYRED